jgi:hypothetical protein
VERRIAKKAALRGVTLIGAAVVKQRNAAAAAAAVSADAQPAEGLSRRTGGGSGPTTFTQSTASGGTLAYRMTVETLRVRVNLACVTYTVRLHMHIISLHPAALHGATKLLMPTPRGRRPPPYPIRAGGPDLWYQMR